MYIHIHIYPLFDPIKPSKPGDYDNNYKNNNNNNNDNNNDNDNDNYDDDNNYLTNNCEGGATKHILYINLGKKTSP
jgi:hypothetical protein